jgi:hypothetical protein
MTEEDATVGRAVHIAAAAERRPRDLVGRAAEDRAEPMGAGRPPGRASGVGDPDAHGGGSAGAQGRRDAALGRPYLRVVLRRLRPAGARSWLSTWYLRRCGRGCARRPSRPGRSRRARRSRRRARWRRCPAPPPRAAPPATRTRATRGPSTGSSEADSFRDPRHRTEEQSPTCAPKVAGADRRGAARVAGPP